MMEGNQPRDASSTESGLDRIVQAWENREGPAVFVTVSAAQAIPNAIYVGEIHYVPGQGFIIADNYFSKTRKNINEGSKGAILFITKERKSFQVKGALTYQTQGPIFDNMKSWHDPKYPGVAAVLLQVKEAYSGAEELFHLR